MLELAIAKRLGAFTLDLAFAAPTPGVVALFGRSGAGKSTIVSAIAGILRPDAGRIALDGTVLFDAKAGIDVPVERRGVGYVFQDARLFPHMSVIANLRYGLRRTDRRQIGFDTVVGLLGIEHLLERRPAGLSGGERQRVALGRALLAQPRLLLMDEPLAALDAERKAEVLPYIERLRDELALPIVYVSHSLDEVVRLSDTIAVVEDGRLAAAGPVSELTARADLPQLVERFDAGTVVETTVLGHDAGRGLTRLSFGSASLLVTRNELPPGRRLRVRVPARDIVLARSRPDAISVRNQLDARVVDITERPRGDVAVRLDIAGTTVLCFVTADATRELGLAPGVPVVALLKSVAVERNPSDG